MPTERISTGIDGLNDLIDGGVPNNSITLVTGDAGTGKTLLCSQFLWEGLENGEKCLYISTEELPEEIVQDAASFGWDFASHDGDSFMIEYIDPSTRSNYFRKDIKHIMQEELQPDRVVIDSISVLGQYWDEETEVRTNITKLIQQFKEEDTTVFMTAEAPDGGNTRYNMAEFVADGVIKMDMDTLGEDVERTIQVTKMRSTKLDAGEHNFEFTENGINLL